MEKKLSEEIEECIKTLHSMLSMRYYKKTLGLILVKVQSLESQLKAKQEEIKKLKNFIQGNLNDAYDNEFVLQEFIDEGKSLID